MQNRFKKFERVSKVQECSNRFKKVGKVYQSWSVRLKRLNRFLKVQEGSQIIQHVFLRQGSKLRGLRKDSFSFRLNSLLIKVGASESCKGLVFTNIRHLFSKLQIKKSLILSSVSHLPVYQTTQNHVHGGERKKFKMHNKQNNSS